MDPEGRGEGERGDAWSWARYQREGWTGGVRDYITPVDRRPRRGECNASTVIRSPRCLLTKNGPAILLQQILPYTHTHTHTERPAPMRTDDQIQKQWKTHTHTHTPLFLHTHSIVSESCQRSETHTRDQKKKKGEKKREKASVNTQIAAIELVFSAPTPAWTCVCVSR